MRPIGALFFTDGLQEGRRWFSSPVGQRDILRLSKHYLVQNTGASHLAFPGMSCFASQTGIMIIVFLKSIPVPLSDHVVQNAQAVPFLCLVQPLQIPVPIRRELEQKFPFVASVRDLPS